MSRHTEQFIVTEKLVPIVDEASDWDLEDDGGPQVGLDDGPVGDPAVSRHGVEAEVLVHVVRAPPHLQRSQITSERKEEL